MNTDYVNLLICIDDGKPKKTITELIVEAYNNQIMKQDDKEE